MPYIKKTLRDMLDPKIDDLVLVLKQIDEDSKGEDLKGATNYTLTRILLKVLGKDVSGKKRYNLINDVIGVLGCVALQYYIKWALPYEDIKKQDNGEVYDV